MIHYVSEYRLNKKGCECFRSRDYDEVIERYRELSAKAPGKYTIQRHDCRLMGPARLLQADWKGRPVWSPWEDATPKNYS